MTLRLRRLLATAVLAAAVLGAGPARASTQVAAVNANVVKPLTIKWLQDLNLGTIVLNTGTWTGATIKITRAGVFSCGAANVTCSGATSVAQYNVTGSNNMTVRISAPDVTLVNQGDSSKTLLMTVDSPGTVVLTSSGAPGNNFSLGGSITVNSTTSGGIYQGTFNVTVDY